jgi:RimJ/RimL family protein N-acetyltransferase
VTAIVETERLVLRMLREDDFEAYARIFTDPEVTRYLGDGSPLDRFGAWRSLAFNVGHWALRGYSRRSGSPSVSASAWSAHPSCSAAGS